MSKSFPRSRKKEKSKEKSAFDVAKGMYSGFHVEDASKIDAEMNKWDELSTSDQLFAIGHLLFLTLKAQSNELLALKKLELSLQEISEQLEDLAFPIDDEDDDDEENDDDVDEDEENDPLAVAQDELVKESAAKQAPQSAGAPA